VVDATEDVWLEATLAELHVHAFLARPSADGDDAGPLARASTRWWSQAIRRCAMPSVGI
jgi:hypothetical protein